MHAIEIIDAELRLVAALREAARERDGPLPSTAPMDEMLDERLAHRGPPQRGRGTRHLPVEAWAR